jgi:hypothetical protein
MPQKNPPIEAILVECAIATGRGLGTKKASPGAADFWTGVYKTSIANALHNGGVWSDDRNAVLLMALKLGRRAKLLAGTGKTVTKANAKKASKIIAADPTCGAGGGRYCPPST